MRPSLRLPAVVRVRVAPQRVALKQPVEGDFSVESDREVMKLLQNVAQLITVRLERGRMDKIDKAEELGAPESKQQPMSAAIKRKFSRQFSLCEEE